ncbi:hypothetical protein HMPREF1548_04144 [Clostridium sp. KLE 1755]|uniref:IS66 family transposase n=1 Tax=Clostridia TaxID=186801 RepID=UPI0003978C52|nr:hypothetical protein HMPREF1548_04144 [Clostridium sp. KLE 1755]
MWVKERLADTSCLPKGKTAKGLSYSVNQEEYLKAFLTDGEAPMDNSASESSIRTFCVGKNLGAKFHQRGTGQYNCLQYT